MTLHQADFILYVINVKLRCQSKFLNNIIQEFLEKIYIQGREA